MYYWNQTRGLIVPNVYLQIHVNVNDEKGWEDYCLSRYLITINDKTQIASPTESLRPQQY